MYHTHCIICSPQSYRPPHLQDQGWAARPNAHQPNRRALLADSYNKANFHIHRRPQWLMCGRCMDAQYPAMANITLTMHTGSCVACHKHTLSHNNAYCQENHNHRPQKHKPQQTQEATMTKVRHCHKATTAAAACTAATSLAGLKQCALGQSTHQQ
jgi:hypothetical protein